MRKFPVPTILSSCLFLAVSLASAETILVDGFDSYAATKKRMGDTIDYKLALDAGRTALVVRNSDSTQAAGVDWTIPDSLWGSVIRISILSRAQGLSQKPYPFNGVKVMLPFIRSDSTREYPQLPWPDTLPVYPWQKSSMVVTLPVNTIEAHLYLGLESVSGTVWFDSLVVERIGSVKMPPARDSAIPIPPSFGNTRSRGAMIGVPPDSASIVEFGSTWKGNLLRWQMNGPYEVDSVLMQPAYESYLQKEFSYLDKGLPICKANGIKAVIDMHQMANGAFLGAAQQTLLIATWKRIAQRYGTNPAVAGYDLANEPDEGSWQPGAMLWNELVDTLCRTIRSVDPNTPIVVEPAWGSVDRFSQLRPVGSDRGWDLKNIVYSFHFYSPYELTAQGEASDVPMGTVYPGTINGLNYDKARLRQEMQPAVDFQKRYRVPMYIGEFSCIRWAPQHSALNWLTDVTSILESQGWDWSYHAYREYQGWSVEYSDSMADQRDRQNTDRKALLLSLYAKNANPYLATAAHPAGHRGGLEGLRWRRAGAGFVSVDGMPKGSTLVVAGPDGRIIQRISMNGKSFQARSGIYWCRLTGSVNTSWEAIPLAW